MIDLVQEQKDNKQRQQAASARHRGREKDKKTGNLQRSKSQGGDVDAMEDETPKVRFKTSPSQQEGGFTMKSSIPLPIIVEGLTPVHEDAGRVDKPTEPTYVPPSGMRMNMGGELEPMPAPPPAVAYKPLNTFMDMQSPLPSHSPAPSPQEKADSAWQKALEEAGLTPRSPSRPLTDLEKPLPPPPPLGSLNPYVQMGESPESEIEWSKESTPEAEKAREYFRDNNFDKKGKLKDGGENLFTKEGEMRGRGNSELWWYYSQNLGVPSGTDKETWEKYKGSGLRQGTEAGQGYSRWKKVEKRHEEAVEYEEGLTRQIFEYRRAMDRERRRLQKEKDRKNKK